MPFAVRRTEGLLSVGDGHRLFFQESGDPAGLPVLLVHGGPGSGHSESARRWFDPALFRIVQYDQRGCGRSTPHAGDTVDALAANTTAHLIEDIEVLRAHLGIAGWLVIGGSWGSTLALAYAQAHPAPVLGLVLHAVALTTPAEIDWITRGVGRFLPQAFGAFVAGAPEAGEAGSVAAAYRARLTGTDPAVSAAAARAWCDWEIALVALCGDDAPHPRYADARFRLGFARLVTHYWANAGFLAPGALLAGAARLAGLPVALVHGRLDLSSPLETAWRLHQALPGSMLEIVETAGHRADERGMPAAIARAIDRVAGRLRQP